MSKEFDDVIDPELNAEALAEAQGKGIQEETTILELLAKNDYGNPIRVKVRYLPQSIASSLEFDDGTPIKKETRNPKFNYRKFMATHLGRMNSLALKNVRIVNDLAGEAVGPKDIKLSLISDGEFKRLMGLCFPGASDDSADSEDEDNGNGGKKRKGLRSRKSDESGA